MNEKKIGSGKVVKKLNREVLIRDGRVTGNKQLFFLGLIEIRLHRVLSWPELSIEPKFQVGLLVASEY